MTTLLVSFCNAFPPGLVLGLLDFESDDFSWVDTSLLGENCRGVDSICWHQGNYWFLAQMAMGGVSALAMMDSSLQLRCTYRLNQTGDAHALTPYSDGFLVTDTVRNRVNFVKLSAEGSVTEYEHWRYCDETTDAVHLNSIAKLDGEVYVSIFGPRSPDGWAYTKGGQVINISRNDVLVFDLFHPHSLANINGELYWLESRTGLIHLFSERQGHHILMQLNGYLRGLTYDDKYLYVGASGRRRRSRSMGTPNILPSDETEYAHSWVYRIHRESLVIEKRRLTAFGAEIFDLAAISQSRSGADLPKAGRDDAIVKRLWRCEDEYLRLRDVQAAMEKTDSLLHEEVSQLRNTIRALEAKVKGNETSISHLS